MARLIAAQQPSAELQFGPFGSSNVEIVLIHAKLCWIDHGPYFGVGGERVTHPQGGYALAQRRQESFVCALRDDQPARCSAALTGGKIGAIDGNVDRSRQISVIQDYQGILATHFELDLGPTRDRFGGDIRSGRCRARERNGAYLGDLTRTSPTTLPRPMTRLNTPLGRPEREMISVNAQALPGTNSAGLNTTELPKHSAGAIFQAGMAMGKFHGVMMPTVPTGSRVTSTVSPGRVDGSNSPAILSASPQKI